MHSKYKCLVQEYAIWDTPVDYFLYLYFSCVVITLYSAALQCNKAQCSHSQSWRASQSTTAALAWAAPDLWGEFITQTAQRWFQYLLGSLFCIRLIWKTVDSCPLYTNEGWPSDWAEATFIMWRSITFLWSNVTFYPHHHHRRPAPTLPMHIEQHAGPVANERGPGWHDVYCTSIWSWCILRCKQGFKLYAPPCQWLRVTLAICLSAAGWEEREERRGEGTRAGVFQPACTSPCVLVPVACMHLLEPHVPFLFLLVPVSPLTCMANGCSLVPSHRRDSVLTITADAAQAKPAYFRYKRPRQKSGWYRYTELRVISLIGTYLFFFPPPTPYIFDFVTGVGRRSGGALLRRGRPRGALALSVPAVQDPPHE